ncbi:MAG: hypothetical protein IT293_03970 [Deltaproteobacteria bacterium]|nr:hypothetical protein [Deltaproteobacteria bacterium]
MRTWQRIVAASLAGVLASCGGGSGSTGLVTSESVVVDDVRANGTCDEFDGVTYCGSDSPNATAPGGESVSVVTDAPTAAPTPTRTATPAATATSVPGGSPTPTDGGSNPSPTATAAAPTPAGTASPVATGAPATPAPTASPAAAGSVTVVLDGFDAGAACASAARALGSDAPWRTASLVPVATGGAPTTFPLPGGVPPPVDLALLCWDAPPATVPAEVGTLAEAQPTVVFVLPSP